MRADAHPRQDKTSKATSSNKPPKQKVHFGFYDSFRLLSHATTLEEDWRALVRNGTCDPSIALLTGHSLGGAFVVFAKILQCE